MNDADNFRVPVGAGTLHVERYGYGGPAFLLLHGFGTSAFLWRHVAPSLALGRCTAFAADLLGYGESDRPFAADFGVTAQAEYLELALTALRVRKATVVGVDIGAVAALRLAYDRPERVERLVLISPSSLQDLPGPEIRELQRSSAKYALRLNRSLLGAYPLFRDFLAAQVGQRNHVAPALVGRYLAPYIGRDGLDHLQTLARAIEDDDLDDLVLSEVRQPALIIRGTRDRFFDAAAAVALRTSLPGGAVTEIPEAGRLVPEEAPVVLAQLLLAGVPGLPSQRPAPVAV
ncbi:MAG: Haloalkane dehalogenase [Gemmatimonadaceae bacterium]|nr:Haloalkane dehalogenase [Gemmatimonadaceae bacterium]